MNIEIINVETIINEILTKTEIYTMIINKLVKITQFNIVNHAFFNSHISELLHYVQLYVNQFLKKLVMKTLIKSNAEHAIDFKKEK